MRSDKWVHSDLNGTDWIGRSQVTRGKITADIRICLDGSHTGETMTLVTEWDEEPCEIPAIPTIFVFWRERGRHKPCASCSDTKEADAKSRSAHDSTDEPSGPCTITREVMSKEWDIEPESRVLAELLVTVKEGCGVAIEGGVEMSGG